MVRLEGSGVGDPGRSSRGAQAGKTGPGDRLKNNKGGKEAEKNENGGRKTMGRCVE